MAAWFFRSQGPEFLVVRRRQLKTHFYEVVLRWVAENFPECSPLFRIRHLPCRIPPGREVVLHIPWLQDPVQRWSPRKYEQAVRLGAECDARGIPIINRVDRLLNASKLKAAELFTAAGIRTPRVLPIGSVEGFRDTLLGLDPPLFVREDWGHGGEMLRADTRDEARRLPVERFRRPVAVELLDFPGRKDGLYRKYRYVAAGDIGVSHHLQMARDWIVRGSNRERTDVSRTEELDYIARQDPNHEMLQRARAALGLEFVAFDYGYDDAGRMVVWEANPYPFIQFSTKSLVYRNAALHRTVAAMLRLYLQYGKLPIPERLEEQIAYGQRA
jgi:hypothetical protein